MSDAELVAICGRRGSGKTTLAKHLIRSARKLVAFDPMAEYGSARGWMRVEDRKGLLDAMRRRWHQGFKIAYTPAADHMAALHYTCDLIWRAQSVYIDADPRPLTLVIEEANLSLPNRPLPASRQGALRCTLQGRHRGIEIVAVTQRPALLNADFRANAARLYVFPLAYADDIDAVARIVGREHREALRTLKPFHYLAVENGSIRPGRVLRSGRIRENSLID